MTQQFDKWWDALNSTATQLSGADRSVAQIAFEAGAAAERERILEAVKTNLTDHLESHGELDCPACAYKRGVRHSIECIKQRGELSAKGRQDVLS